MASKLSDDKIERILDLYRENGSLSKTAQEVGVAKGTVKKYVDRHIKSEEEEEEKQAPSKPQSSVVEMSGDDTNLADLTDDELMDMSESEFIRTFFDEFADTGVKSSFVELIANQAKVRQQIPDQDQMAQRIQSHNSGVGNANDANAIAELYWALAQRYLRARGMSSSMGQMAGMMGGVQSSGDWVGTGAYNTSPPQQQTGPNGGKAQPDGGDWVSTAPGPQQNGPQIQQQPGQGGQMQHMAQMFHQMQQQQQQMMERMMSQQQQSGESKIEQKIDQLEQRMSTSSSGPADSLQEYVELKQTLEKLNDDGGVSDTEQIMATLQQQLQALQQEVRNGASNGMSDAISQTDSELGLLAALAQSGTMEPSQVAELAQTFGQVETHPEVAQKKYDKEIEEMKVRAEQEKWESILDGFEGLTQNFGGALSMFAGGDGGGETEQPVSGRAQTAAKQNPQVVEESMAAEPEPQDNQSPARRLVESGGEADEADPEPVESVSVSDEAVAEREYVAGAGAGGDDGGVGSTVDEVEFRDVKDDDASGDGETDDVSGEIGGVVCACGKEFETKQQLNGHRITCDEAE